MGVGVAQHAGVLHAVALAKAGQAALHVKAAQGQGQADNEQRSGRCWGIHGSGKGICSCIGRILLLQPLDQQRRAAQCHRAGVGSPCKPGRCPGTSRSSGGRAHCAKEGRGAVGHAPAGVGGLGGRQAGGRRSVCIKWGGRCCIIDGGVHWRRCTAAECGRARPPASKEQSAQPHTHQPPLLPPLLLLFTP